MTGSSYPNPFNSCTTIRFQVSEPGPVVLTVYNILGREIKQFENRYYQAGKYTLAWDGTDDRGISVSSGIYFIHYMTPIYTKTIKICYIK